MDKFNELLDSECSVAHDLKRDKNIKPPSLNCITEIVKENNQTLEDKNRNLTLKSSKEPLGAEDGHLSSSPSNDKANLVGVHVGTNGLINGIGIEPCKNLTHLFDIPSSVFLKTSCSGNKDDSSHTKKLEQSDCQIDKLSRGEKPNKTILSENSKINTSVDSIEKSKIENESDIEYVSYKSELQMPDIMRLIQKDLSEPYSIYTYRYFIHNWPKLCFLAMDGTKCVGAIVCKLDMHRKVVKRGYIAMLAVDEKYRKRKIGSNLVLKAIRAMVADSADEVVLETEITNRPALRLYENLGFVRDKRLFRYYLNGVDALRLKLWLR
uniref:N-terminal methionine N(alpha)-acetyltransferase NatC n=1 Tax=Clastoptera arizonana TaxID=38151 RepID=A0A1B6DB49_9HEMI